MGIHSKLYVRPTLGFFTLSQHVMHDVENDKGDNLIKKWWEPKTVIFMSLKVMHSRVLRKGLFLHLSIYI